jgi:hypothetical protein
MKRLADRIYHLDNMRTKYVALFLDPHLTPHIRIFCISEYVVLNLAQWFILVSFKDGILDNKIHELGDSHHTMDLYCGKYVRIICHNEEVVLTKFEWKYLMQLAESFLNKHITEMFHLRNDLQKWHKKCLETNSFVTPPNTTTINFEVLYDDLMHN